MDENRAEVTRNRKKDPLPEVTGMCYTEQEYRSGLSIYGVIIIIHVQEMMGRKAI